MSEPVDGVPHPPTAEEIAEYEKVNPLVASLMRANARKEPPQEVIEKVPLTEEEWATLRGLFAAQEAVNAQILGYQSQDIAKRLGLHPSRFLQINLTERWISVRAEKKS